MVDEPNNSGSIPEAIFFTDFVKNLGWSDKLLKNLNTAF
jgi:hypothetical protein